MPKVMCEHGGKCGHENCQFYDGTALDVEIPDAYCARIKERVRVLSVETWAEKNLSAILNNPNSAFKWRKNN
jgi:hypothetical protein